MNRWPGRGEDVESGVEFGQLPAVRVLVAVLPNLCWYQSRRAVRGLVARPARERRMPMLPSSAPVARRMPMSMLSV
jgi:hypothetical protein